MRDNININYEIVNDEQYSVKYIMRYRFKQYNIFIAGRYTTESVVNIILLYLLVC